MHAFGLNWDTQQRMSHFYVPESQQLNYSTTSNVYLLQVTEKAGPFWEWFVNELEHWHSVVLGVVELFAFALHITS